MHPVRINGVRGRPVFELGDPAVNDSMPKEERAPLHPVVELPATSEL